LSFVINYRSNPMFILVDTSSPFLRLNKKSSSYFILAPFCLQENSLVPMFWGEVEIS
jgi:hypothetical protein